MTTLHQPWTPEHEEQVRSYVDRYLAGNPEEISRLEAVARFREVAPELSTVAFEDAAASALQRLDGFERSDLLRWLEAGAHELGSRIPAAERPDPDGDPTPQATAAVVARLEREQPRVLDAVLGRADLPVSAKLAFGGIAAYGARRLLDH